ncbi:CBS domain-containing protein [Candidatus Nitrospira bockiana]
MQIRTKSRLARRLFLDRDIERFRQQLLHLQPLLVDRSPTRSGALAEFDLATERLISQVFGETSELLEAYEYAKLGEAASLVNLPEEAQEHGAHDVERESLQQRKRVLDSCISELEALRDFKARTHPRVADYMTATIRTIGIDATLREAAMLLEKWGVGSLLVTNGSRYVGIITDTDLSRKAVARGLDPSATSINTCMTKPVISVEQNEPITAAIGLMKEHGIRHLVVTKDGMVLGVLSVSDIVRYYSDVVPMLRTLAGLTENGSPGGM